MLNFYPNQIRLILVVSLSLLTLSCGNGDGPVSLRDEARTGRFLDAAVAGINYRTATQSGVTNTQGEFRYRSGEAITFSVGGINLGTTVGASVITPVEATDSTSPDDQQVKNMLVFLQSIDDDADHSNGINISVAAQSLAQGLNLNFSDSNFTTLATAAVSQITAGANSLVSESVAFDNFFQTYTDNGGASFFGFQFPEAGDSSTAGIFSETHTSVTFSYTGITNSADFGGNSTVANPTSTAITPVDGSVVLEIDYQSTGGVFGGAILQFGSMDVSAYDKLIFSIDTSAVTGFANLTIQSEPPGPGPMAGNNVALASYTPVSTSGNWSTYEIPFSDFSAVDFTVFGNLGLWNARDSSDGLVYGKIYFDNIYLSATVTEPNSAPAAPTRDGTVSIFSDAYTDITGINYNPNWGQATVTTTETIAGNSVIKQVGLNYQGIDFSGNAQNVSATDMLHIDFWTPDATAINLSLVSSGPVEAAYALPIVTGSWQSVDIPLSSFSGVDLTNVIQMKFDDATTGESATIFIDNIYFFNSAAPIVAPTTPTASGTVSIFSDAYTDITGVDYNPNWGQATVTTTETIAGNLVIKQVGLNYQGIDFSGNAQDVSALDTLHIDFWTPSATAVNLSLVSSGPVEAAYALPIVIGSWQSVDIPLSSFSGVDLTSVIQMKFDDATTGESATIFIDNIYFYNQ